jgi:hypothetical protein
MGRVGVNSGVFNPGGEGKCFFCSETSVGEDVDRLEFSVKSMINGGSSRGTSSQKVCARPYIPTPTHEFNFRAKIRGVTHPGFVESTVHAPAHS